jgi:hypothetical protein
LLDILVHSDGAEVANGQAERDASAAFNLISGVAALPRHLLQRLWVGQSVIVPNHDP